MANSRQISRICTIVMVLLSLSIAADGQLSKDFYKNTCPNLGVIVRNAMKKAVESDRRAAASILRIFFHDCFVNGCDASILLEGRENNVNINRGLRSFDVIDTIKEEVEEECNGTVSCADILALAALEGVAAVGGPRWSLGLGRRDAKSASESDVGDQIPSATSNLANLKSTFAAKGLSAKDMSALSGAHTIGLAQCRNFRDRIYNESNIDETFAASKQENCPLSGGDGNTEPLDSTSRDFDNQYFKNLVDMKGLLHSDQELFNGGSQDNLVRTYSTNQKAFFSDFQVAMTKMSNIDPLTGTNGEIRRKCGTPN